MKISRKKLIVAVLTCMIFTLMMSTTAFATGDVAGAVEGTWNEASVQVKQVGIIGMPILIANADLFNAALYDALR